ncbi:MAG: prepilin-type N-terminal cleavage/methylation domain-containing protein [Sedimentisphaerales bacterium]|nr:prepilin-type N-terminal cleavage/methylation domain-containing protein [Sedimentisphaerales bacterium]
MKSRSRKYGLTLVEMLLVIALIVILVGMVVGVAKRIDDQSKERLCVSTIELVGNAMEQFRDFGYEYKNGAYIGLAFPIDCNGFTVQGLPRGIEQALGEAIYPAGVVVNINQIEPVHDVNWSGSEVLYFCLSRVPDCKSTLGKIDKSLLTNTGNQGLQIDISIIGSTTITEPFTRIIDPWGTALRYSYYDKFIATLLPDRTTKKTFPIITSAGPDGVFDTGDDISNRKLK